MTITKINLNKNKIQILAINLLLIMSNKQTNKLSKYHLYQ